MQIIAGTLKSRRRFLTDLTLEPPSKSQRAGSSKKKDDEAEFVTISTVHSAKGLEWPAVYVLSVVEGGLPSSRAEGEAQIKEERRLLYVAMTRAKRRLTLVVPLQKPGFGNGSYNGDIAMVGRSRFVPDAICSHFELSAWRSQIDDDKEWSERGTAMPTEIEACIRKRWGAAYSRCCAEGGGSLSAPSSQVEAPTPIVRYP